MDISGHSPEIAGTGSSSVPIDMDSNTNVNLRIGEQDVPKEASEPFAIKSCSEGCWGQCNHYSKTNNLRRMYHAFAEFYRTGEFCDTVLMTEDNSKFNIHAIVVAGDSAYFNALFTGPLTSPNQKEFLIRGITSDMMKMLLDFIYTRKIVITEDNVTQILESADYLGIVAVKDLCCEFIEHQMSPYNCIGIKSFAESMFCRELSASAHRFLMRYFPEVSEESEELLELPVDKTISILGHDELNVKSEEIVWKAVIRWISQNPEVRKQYIVDLIQQVRTGLMETQYFMENVKDHAYVAGNEGCKPIVIETLKFLYDLEVASSARSPGSSLTPGIARPRIPHEVIFAIGGWSGGNPTNVIETYDTRADRWTIVQEVDPTGPRAYHGTVAIGLEIVIIGGFDGTDYFNTTRAFNTQTKTWRSLAPMHTRRCYVSVAMLDGHIYAMGGYDGTHRQNTVEKYDIVANQWTNVNPMNEQRSDASAAELNGKIYITGGFNGSECLSTAEVYDPATNQWTMIPPMRNRRSGVSCLSFHNQIYVLGGFNGITRMSSVERYDPVDNYWSAVPDMYNQRSNFAVEVIDDMIFCIGGFNGSTTIYHVECYDDRTREWYEATDMNVFRSALSAVVVSGLPNITDYIHQNREKLMEEKRQRIHSIAPLPTHHHL